MITSWLIENFLAASVLTLVILSVQRSLRWRPTLKHALWLLVLVKLVTPPVYNWPWAIELSSSAESKVVAEIEKTEEKAEDNRWESLPNEMKSISGSESALPVFDSEAPIDYTLPNRTEEIEPRDFSLFESNPVRPLDGGGVPAENPATDKGLEETALEKLELAPVTPSRQIWFRWGLGIWISGTILFVFIQSTRIIRTILLLRNASPVPESLENKLEQFAHRLGVKCPDIVAVAGIKTPLIWAVGRARLLWPLELASKTSEWNEMKRWRGVLIHELAHLHRRDHWVGWLELFAGLLWWWNPFFWVARRQLRENAELACDAWAVQCLPEERRNYAETLLEVCQLKSRSVMPWPVVGASLRDRRSLERRLEMILKDNVMLRIPKLGLVAVLVLAVMALPGWSQKRKTDDPELKVGGKAVVAINPAVQVKGKVDLTIDPAVALKDPELIDLTKKQSSQSKRNAQLKQLEDTIAVLQKQLKALKANKNAKDYTKAKTDSRYQLSKKLLKYPKLNTTSKSPKFSLYPKIALQWQQNLAKQPSFPGGIWNGRNPLTYTPLSTGQWRAQPPHVVESQTFSRVKYRLPKDAKKAKAVTDFVKAMFGGDGDKKKTHSIESGDDNTLTVIASTAIQSKISSIIQMAHGDTKVLDFTRQPASYKLEVKPYLNKVKKYPKRR